MDSTFTFVTTFYLTYRNEAIKGYRFLGILVFTKENPAKAKLLLQVEEKSKQKKAALGAAFFKYVSDYASAMMITLIEVITSE